MFQKLDKTQYPPSGHPIMLWDGSCGFCAYWTTRWNNITQGEVDYRPYQEVANQFPDIDLVHFKQASRLIERDGKIYSGPRSAYRTFTYGNSKWRFLDRWYENKAWFQKLSDHLYQWVADHRNGMFKLTKLMFGSNPEAVKPFWFIYLCTLLYLIYVYI